MRLTIASSDPGTKNYGFGVVQFKVEGNTVKYKVVHTCKLTKAADIKNADIKDQLAAFNKETKAKFRVYKPTHLIAERFMTRGIKGPLVESVNMMLGVLAYANKQPVIFVPAVVWKNRVNKFFDLKAFYKEAGVEAHEVDAVLMAFFAAERITGKDVLPRFAKAKERTKLLRYIEQCTDSVLKVKKGTKKK